MTALARSVSDDQLAPDPSEGCYVYGVVRADDGARVLEQAPVPGAGPAHVVRAGELGVVVSAVPLGDVDPSRRNLLAHTRILEEAMEQGPILPVRFGTIADHPDALGAILERHGEELSALFAKVENRVELGVKAFWNMQVVFAEIIEDNTKIRQLKDQLQGSSEARTYYQRIDLGRRIEDAMAVKREEDAAVLSACFAPLAAEIETAKATEDRMVLNAAFLVDADREAAFDAVVEDVRNRQGARMTLRYVGPVPPYSFVNLSIDWSQSA